MQLPDALWLQDPALRRVVDTLKVDGQPPRIVGGAVRDALLGIAVADVDIATPLVPADVIKRLEASQPLPMVTPSRLPPCAAMFQPMAAAPP